MDLKSINKYGYFSIDQYCPPLCFELAGSKFELVMDDGYDFILNFHGKEKLEWHRAGEEPKVESYKCLKADDTTYLVNYELEGASPRVCHTFVIDLENMLVTRIVARIGSNPRYPYLIYTDFEFGAIRRENNELTFKRHGYTSDMIGNVVQWTYGSQLATVHVYYCAHFYRITYPSDRIETQEGMEVNKEFREMMRQLPSSDEPAVYIKIKNGLYLFSLIEQNMERMTAGKMQFRSNTLCFLQNYNRMYQVGRGFGTSTTAEGDRNINIMIGAYGKFVDVNPNFLKDPNPYLT